MRLGIPFLGLSLAAFFALAAAGIGQPEKSASKVGQKVMHLPSHSLDGRPLPADGFQQRKAIVVVFLSFECPVSNSYVARLNELEANYRDKGVTFLGILPSEEEAASLAKQAKEFRFSFPLAHDPKRETARAFGVTNVPEAFVLDREMIVRYRGRIDDGYAARLKKKAVITRHDLQIALDEVLAGRPVSVAATTVVGCPIPYEKPRAKSDRVTYHRDVLPILQKRCQSCHRPGEIGPFSLMTYRQAVNWAPDIKEYTRSRQMPPWMPAEGLAFKSERKMTDAEIATLAAWVDNGTPEGDPKDAPPPLKFTDGWQLGEPDLVFEPKEEITIAADGRDLFRCFVFPTGLKEDVFIRAYEVRPANRRAVHHTIHFLDTAGRARRLEETFQKKQKPDARDFGPGYNSMMGPGFFPPSGDAGGWAPGIRPHFFPENVGYFLPKGSDFIVQVHYHRTGRVEKDRPKVGLYLSKSPDCKPLQTMVMPGRFFSIPPGASSYRVKGDLWAAQDCTLYTVTPHMHLLGKSIKVTMTPPGGKAVTLVGIDHWNYNWQEIYHLQTPLRVKAGTRFSVEAVYDNSESNPRNPFSPPRTVFLGEQTTNEMCFVFLGCTTDDGSRIGFRLTENGPVIRRIGQLPKR